MTSPSAVGSGPSAERHVRGTPVTSVVVVQPTPFCNINCSYCYLPDRADASTMADDTLRALFGKLFTSGWAAPQVTVIWHAGEPLVMPVAWYERAFALIESLRPPDVGIHHSFQTNGTLLTRAWCDLFKRWHVGVGVSIDGPRRFNDAHRVGRDGRSTYDKVIAGIRLLHAEAVPFHVISVLTDASLGAADEMLAFYRAERIDEVCFNVEESEGSHVSALFASAAPGARFRAFLEQFWREARRAGDIAFIREVDGMIPRVFRPEGGTMHNVQVEPFAMLNVDCHGNVATYSPELLGLGNAAYGDFIVGNVNVDTLEAMRASPVLAAMARDIDAGVEQCRATCDYFAVCGGGAPINKLTENGSFASTATGFCELTQKIPADIVLDAFDRLQGVPVALPPQAPAARRTIPLVPV
ncbi:MAG: GRRM system radical SAM/SPASM domain protein [Proteobacteria bacterium]|nr:GRRM system radical SAM/SPASM domain protein [Pseudomonadota bacterium]